MEKETQWHDCVFYGGVAQFAASLLKGTHVLVEGELTYSEYARTVESEHGPLNVQWPVTEIVVDSIKILDRRSKGTDEEGAA
jgi:single-strand DNA-binding protein